MTFDALRISYELIGELKTVVGRLVVLDRDGADQLKRAASSVANNLAEGRGRAGADQRRCWRIARGSLEETRAVLMGAVAWGHLAPADVAAAMALADRVAAMTWRLTH